MDMRRLRVALKVVQTKYVETKDLIEDECQKENIYVKEVIFFKSRGKKLTQKKMVFCSEYVKSYFIKLNSLGYNIYLHII